MSEDFNGFSLLLSRGGGLERYAYELVKELSKGNEVVVICSTKRESRDEKIGKIKVLRKNQTSFFQTRQLGFCLPFEL